MANTTADSRFRSFAERYVIERARNWPADGNDRENAWKAMLDARGIYDQIGMLDKAQEDPKVGGVGSVGMFPTTAAKQQGAPPYPTSDPGIPGVLWNNGGTLCLSKGAKSPPPSHMSAIVAVSPDAWIEAGPEAVADAVHILAKNGHSPPPNLMHAMRTLAAGIKNILKGTTNGKAEKPSKTV